MEETTKLYRLRCDNCKTAQSPSGATLPEARDLAKHLGWILHAGKHWCVECFTRLPSGTQRDMILEAHLEQQ